jgi:outer membrane protein assembly factor BamB
VNRSLRTALLALPLLAASCMPPIRVSTAFSSRFGDNDRAKIATVLERLARGTTPDNARPGLLAAVVQGDTRAVALYDVAARRALWTQPMAASSTPEIVGDAVVVEVGSSTVILDLATGATRGRWEHTGLDLVGASRDGDTLVLCAASGLAGGTRRAGRVVALDARSGAQRWSHNVGGLVGRPAARAGLAFIPWDRQSIAVLDLATGVEQARVRSTDDVLSWVASFPDGIYYGGRGIYRFGAESAAGTRAGSAFLANPLEGVPGDPLIFRDGFLASTGSRTARDKIQFGFATRPGEGSHVALQGDTVVLGYYHDIVAVDAASGSVRWAQRVEEDIESLTVTANGVFVVSATGKVRGLELSTGAVSTVAELGASLGAVSLSAAGLTVPAGGTAPEGSVREQLVAMVRDADNRLVPFRAYLVGMLARIEDENVTHDLLDLYTQRSIPVQLKQRIASALQARRNGASFLIQALQEHYDYLEGRQAPPLQVIAPTLVAMAARESVPGLISHLLDHETPLAALPDVIAAIGALGEASSVPTLQRWVQLYRADTTFRGENAVALNTANDAIFRHGDAAAHEWLRARAQDTSVPTEARTHIDELFARAATDAQTRASQATESERQEALQTELNHLREAQAAVPAQLSDEALDGVWNAHLDALRECAQGAVTRNPTLNQIRVVVTLRGDVPRPLLQSTPPREVTAQDGTRHRATAEESLAWAQTQQQQLAAQHAQIRLSTYAPNDPALRTCMDAALQAMEFPAFRELRQEFRRVIDTRGARAAGAEGETYAGLGINPQGRELPWWLVSAPTLAVENPPPPAPAPIPGIRTTPAVRPATPPTGTPPTGTAPTGTPPAGTPPPAAGQRPWWEE